MTSKNIHKILLSAALLVSAPAVMALGYNYYEGYNHLKLDANVSITNKTEKINLSLRDSDVKQVLRMFADKAGLNIIFDSSVKGSVTLDLVNVSLNDAFKLVLKISGLTYYLDDNTLVIMSVSAAMNESFAAKEMTILPVRYVDAAKIAEFLNKNIFSKKRTGLSTTEVATVNTATNELIIFGMDNDVKIAQSVIDQFDKKPLSATFIVNHTTPAEMASMVCNMLSPGGGSVSGEQINTTGVSETSEEGATGFASDEEGGGGEEAESSGGSSDPVKLGENYVACTLAGSVTLGSTVPFNTQNLKVSYYPQRGTIKVVGGSQSQIDMIGDFIKENDIKQPQALVELSILELTEDGSKEFSNNWSITGGDITFNSNADGTTIAHATNQSRMKIGWEMSYLLQTEKARILANPKLVVTNGKEAVIDLTQDYLESVDVEFLQTSGAGAAAVAQKTYNIGSDQGLKVAFTPFISPEGYVTMNITPEYSTQSGQITGIEYDEEGNREPYIAATLLSRRNLDIKNVRIKDGETLIIGGLIQETTNKSVSKIPILGDLPGIGAAFRSTTSEKVKTELVIMITPKIIKDNEDASINNL